MVSLYLYTFYYYENYNNDEFLYQILSDLFISACFYIKILKLVDYFYWNSSSIYYIYMSTFIQYYYEFYEFVRTIHYKRVDKAEKDENNI